MKGNVTTLSQLILNQYLFFYCKCLWMCSIVIFWGGKNSGMIYLYGDCRFANWKSKLSVNSNSVIKNLQFFRFFEWLRYSLYSKSYPGMSDGVLKRRWQSLRAGQANSCKKTGLSSPSFSRLSCIFEENVFLLKNGEQLFWKCWLFSLDPPFQIMYLRSSVFSH